jgi:glycosyltransferase involved in cell wall biosynthesis
MRILYITNKISPAGGLERVLAIKTSAMADDFGHDVHILTLNQGKEEVFHAFSPRIRMHDISVPSFPISFVWAYVKGIRALVAAIEPDIVDVCDDGLKAFFVPLILGKGIPVVYERHVSKVIEFNAPGDSWLKRMVVSLKYRLMQALAPGFARFVVLTAGNVPEWGQLPNLVVQPNPLTFYPDRVSTLSNKRVLAIGRHAYQKGFDLLLEAWKLVQEKHPDWRLDLYGKEDPSLGLQNLAGRLKLESSVHFFEPVSDIENQYLEASVYVLSSRFEGFGMVLTEAMACGVPCVSFDCPCGPSDIIQHEADGLLVSNGDVAGLADAVCRLISDQELRRQMGKNARKNVLRFSRSETVAQWDSLFSALTTLNRKPHG